MAMIKENIMGKRLQKAPWICAILTVSSQFVFIHMTTYMHFGLPDDIAIYRMLMGFWGGVPIAHTPYVGAILSYPIYLLGKLFPSMPWFGILQLSFLWLSCVVICKALIQIPSNNKYTVYIGYGLYLLYSFAFLMERCATITYSNTVAVMTAAAVMQLLISKDNEKGIYFSIGILSAAYALRSAAALPGIIVWIWIILVFAIMVKVYRKGSLLIYIRSVAILLFCFLIMFTLNIIDQSNTDNKEYEKWQKARTQLVDYSDIYALSVKDFEEIGLSERELILYEGGLLWDSKLSTNSLEKIYARYKETIVSNENLDIRKRLGEAFENANKKNYDFPYWWRIACLLTLLSLALIFANREKRILTYLFPLGVFAITVVLFGYLAVINRYPTQALAAILYPSNAALLYLSYVQLPRKINYRMILSIIFILPCIFFMLKAAKTAYHFYTNPQPGWWQNYYENEFAEYVNQHPDLFFWVDNQVAFAHNTIYADMTVTKNTLPLKNWDTRSSEKQNVLKSIGIDPEAFSYDILLREDMRIITYDKKPPDTLLAAIQISTGSEIDAEIVDTYKGMNVFRIFIK
jgi:hypothetical protein